LDVSKGHLFVVQLVDNQATTITLTNTLNSNSRAVTNGQRVVIEVVNPASGTVPVALLAHGTIWTNSVTGERTTYPWTNSTTLVTTDFLGILWSDTKTKWRWIADKHKFD
jgi:hypothetical protein